MHPSLAAASESSRPLWVADETTWAAVSESLPPLARAFARAQGFDAKPGSHCLLPDANGRPRAASRSASTGPARSAPIRSWSASCRRSCPRAPTASPVRCPIRSSRPSPGASAPTGFERYRKPKGTSVRLVVPEGVDAGEVSRIARAVGRGRDLVNTPANDLGPDGIEAAARALADEHGAAFTSIVGDDLLARGTSR